MTADRAIRFGLMATLLSGTAACASLGGKGGEVAVVTDPAPIVSGTMRPYQIRGRWYRPEEQPRYDETGMASWYGNQFHNRATASGERFDQNALTAAHKTLPLPGLVEVTNLANGRRIVARVNDRGPFAENRIIDLSRGSADALGMLSQGVGEVRVRYLGRAPRLGGGMPLQHAANQTPARRDGLRGPVPYSQVVAAPPPAAPLAVPAASVAEAAPLPPIDMRPALSLAPAASTPGVWVQAGAYDDLRQARRTADRLGGSAKVEPGLGGYRVLVGPWPDGAAAERSRRAVISRGYPEALLISSR
jgi:rare lipoprotein A